MEIRAEELRIGNLITDIWASEGSAFEVVRLSSKHQIIKYGAAFSANIKNIKGIPLTEEWLVKFGFNRNDNKQYSDSFYHIKLSASELQINPDNGVVWIYNPIGHSFNNPLLIEYVHQLQNLYFALTGEELKIQNS